MSSDLRPFPREVRQILLRSLPEDTSLHGAAPELRYTYVPVSHAKALRPDSMLVVGMRGAGKSFWWSALQDDRHRALVAEVASQAGISASTRVAVGFGERPEPEEYPGKRLLSSLGRRFEPHEIWEAVVLWQLAGEPWLPGRSRLTGFRQAAGWPKRIEWIRSHPERVEETLAEADAALDKRNHHWLVLFDALDRTANDWPTMSRLIRGLLQVLLDLRPYRRLRAKVFLRSDQMDEAQVGTFPDASKLLSAKVELEWPPRELYNLFWQYLANEPFKGCLFRSESCSRFGLDWREHEDVWLPPPELRGREDLQRDVFHAITGPWMGRDRRRGYPYTWVPNHLGDAERQVSPRSFLAALRAAAQDTEHRYAEHECPLHYESIKRGVQEASKIRVKEIVEDYRWVDSLMEPLEEATVPCEFSEIRRRWEESGALEPLRREAKGGDMRLPPAHLEEGPEGVRKDLEELGIFERMRDGRVNVPDVFRVGYRLRRRGGVVPVAKR